MPDQVVKSVGRVIEVLELFDTKRDPLTGRQVANELGYPMSSTNALLKSLVRLGYLSWCTQTGRYFPTLNVANLGSWILDDLMADETLRILDALHKETSETITLSTQNDLGMQLVRVIPGTFPISLRVQEGYLGPLFKSAVGTACLSLMNDKQIEQLLERGKRTPNSIPPNVQLADILEEVQATRERGCAIGYDLILPDTGAVAMALPNRPNFVVGVGGLSARIRRSEEAIVKAMKKAVGVAAAKSGQA